MQIGAGGLHLVVSPTPGLVDAALFGLRDRGIAGEGDLATLSFRRLREGDPNFTFGEIDARDANNEPVIVAGRLTVDLPRVTTLHQNAPNPFNPKTTIYFDLASKGPVALKIYGVDGRLVRTLVNEELTVGRYTAVWNGTDDTGRRLASGTYLLRLQVLEKVQTRKMLLLK